MRTRTTRQSIARAKRLEGLGIGACVVVIALAILPLFFIVGNYLANYVY